MKKLIILLVLLFACKQPDKGLCGQILFFKNTVLLDNKQVTIHDKQFCSKQTIETKIDSSIVIQFSEHAIVTLKQNSKLNLIKAKNSDPEKIYINLKQESGSSFSKIKKNKADFIIKTPTVVAGVRGTAFETICDKDKTEIKMLEGSVALYKSKNDVPLDEERYKVYIYANEKVIITPTRIETPKEVTQEEYDRMKVMAQIEPGMKEFSRHTILNSSKNSETYKVAPEKTVIKKLTIDDLKKLYGRLSIIRTKDGYEYIGSFKQDGNKMVVFTVSKTFYINVSNIEKVLPYDK